MKVCQYKVNRQTRRRWLEVLRKERQWALDNMPPGPVRQNYIWQLWLIATVGLFASLNVMLLVPSYEGEMVINQDTLMRYLWIKHTAV